MASSEKPSTSLREPRSNDDNARSPSPLIIYNPPSALSLLRAAAINLVLPFINGLMLGFGELFAHELAFRWGWSSTRVFPERRIAARSHVAGPGVEIRERDNNTRRLEDLTSLE